MSLVPVNFSAAEASILKSNDGITFEFAPVSTTVLPLKARQLMNATPSGNDLDLGDWADDLKNHFG